MRTAKRILAEFMTVVMVLQACSPTVATVAAGWQNISSEIAAASAEASDAAENGETKDDAAAGSGSSDAGAAGDGTEDGAAKDDTAAGDTSGDATGSDSTDDQTEGDDAAGDAAADDAEQDADAAASEDAEAQADATITDLDELVRLLEKNGAESIELKDDGSGNQRIASLNVKSSEAFSVLSNADASLYYDTQIKSIITGDAKLTETAAGDKAADDNRLSFQGLGSDEHPFEGRIYSVSATGGDNSVELTTDRTVFNNLKLTGQNNTVKIKWVGATTYSAPMIASKISGEGQVLNATVNIADPSGKDPKGDTTSALTAPLLGETTGELTVNVTYSLTGSRKNLNVNASGNVGLLANTVESGTFTVGSVEFPSDLASDGIVETSSGNAGLLVGAVEDDATLSVGTLPMVPTATVQSTSGCAGGVVGLVGSSTGATVNVTEALDLQTLTVKGTTASGGFIGKATMLTLSADNKQIACPLIIGDASSACSGGVIGDVSFAQEFAVTSNMFDLGDGVTLGATQRAGALFGVADISAGDIVVQGGTYKSKLASGNGGGSYGGLVGKVLATAKGDNEALRALVVQNDADKKTCTIEFNLASEMSDAGGVVGYVGDSAAPNSQPVAVVLNGVTVTCKGDASARTDTGKLGGAVGVVDTRSVLDVRDFTLTSDKAIGGAAKNRAAGVAGSAWNAVIKFSGITDLSGASFAENSTTGQLIYENNNALIFAAGNGSNGELADKGATGWTFKRSKQEKASKTDDIATYGEVVRLGQGSSLGIDFIKLDPDTHVLTLSDSLTPANGVFTLGSVEDFAKLAITWQTNGYYSMVNGVSDGNLNGLQSSTITVNGTIDLAGTGLMGLTQDRASDTQVFSGTLNGSGTIILAVGEPYGMRDGKALDSSNTSKGNGKIYRHGRLGLFAAVNGASVSSITIAGSMKFDNGSAIDAGSLAGTIVGAEGEKLTLSGVTCEVSIVCDDTLSNDVNIGGIAGSVSAATTVDFNNSTKAQATISTGGACYGNTRIGGAIGYVGDVAAIFTATALQIGGSIRADASATAEKTFDEKSSKIVQAGGFIGSIAQGTEKFTTEVNITGLLFSSFNMTVGKSGDRRNGAGGLLGYSWGNAIVNMEGGSADRYALTLEGSSVTADMASEVGGLVYAASGHWIINDYAINLSGVNYSAIAAEAFGVLIARASKTENKDAQKYGVEVYTGLYLEDRAYWGDAYRVEGASINISDNQLKVFDEWIAYGVNPVRKLIDGDWNAVVSLHTEEPDLDTSGDPNGDNSYKNRTSVGQKQKYVSNGKCRYYYNLDRAWTEVKDLPQTFSAAGWMDRPEYLLLWCARLYAPLGVRNYIAPASATILDRNNIGSSGSSIASIDLTGYSFYPMNVSNRDIQIKNAKITLCYSKIKAEQQGNKSNDSATQHENMHCGLIRTIGGKNLTVENVVLSGTVGRAVNDVEGTANPKDPESVSGALVLRCAYGASGTSMATIIINDLTLDGLQVDGADDKQYAPLLINAITRYVNLDVKNVMTSNYADSSGANKTAASSLFGQLGYDKSSNQVTAKFECISLPSQTGNSIFTHASLLESFGYGSTSTGSADYTFTKADAKAGMVTYGSEIDAKDKEYSGKQLWYYDEETYATKNGLVEVGGKTASAETPQFGDYLPYVYKGKATVGNVQYHEIKVNQRLPKLLTGCGTYGDPYTVKDATEMNAIANYINNGTALDGWEVTITVDQSKLCERRSDKTKTDNEVVYVYKQSNPSESRWEKKVGETTDSQQTLADETMRRYIQSAYYSIEPAEGNKITIDAASFGGFGNKANPFRGVIVGNLGASTATIEIENNKGELRGLIPYSYGSVVRNLNIRYKDAQATITYSAKDTDGVPTAFFGGVVGCILGGDNIIDGVVVNGTTADDPVTGFTVSGGGTKSHLVPIGGYVGTIAGGGVIFRNMSGTSWRAGTKTNFKSAGEGGANYQLYDNPYVGRVIDGYAFSEGDGYTVDNGDANYKINQLDTTKTRCIETEDISGHYRGTGNNKAAVTTTVKNKQGLLVLSAIISSGAAGGSANTSTSAGPYGTPAGSRAYLGGNKADGTYQFGNQQYGKVRNASYASVGKPEGASGDFAVAINDDMQSPGIQAEGNALDYTGDGSNVNSPYLVKKYATWQTGYICAAQVSGMDLQFALDKYDMTTYGSGFTGLSGRYYSNACASASGADRDRIVPLVACINGNGATIKVGSKKDNKVYGVTEYADDDYKVAGVGALFSTVSFTSANVSDSTADGMVKNLDFVDCDVELTIKDTNGTGQAGDNVGVGLLAGVTANNDGGVSGIYRKVTMDGCKVAGAKNVGGLLGSSGYCSRAKATTSTSEIIEKSRTASPVKLYDCSYTNMDVSGSLNVGGYVGAMDEGTKCGIWTTTTKNATVASNSTVAGTSSGAHIGGAFGWTKDSVSVAAAMDSRELETTNEVKVSNVTVKADFTNAGSYMGVGGLIGRADYGIISISNLSITSDQGCYIGNISTNRGNLCNAGGVIGFVNSRTYCRYWFNSCTVKGLRLSMNSVIGGVLGYFWSTQGVVYDNITVEDLVFDGQYSGGLTGRYLNSIDVSASNVKIASNAFQQANSGGISGEGKGKFHLANVLLDSNTFNSKDQQGILLGNVDTNNLGGYELYAAGVSVKLAGGQTNATMPALIRASDSSKIGEVNNKSYVAFGDYEGALSDAKGVTLYGNDATTGNVTAAVSPCVTTSPTSSLVVRASDTDTTDRYLFGDGMNVDLAAAIQSPEDIDVAKRYIYTNIGGINDDGAYQNSSSYKALSVKSAFNENNEKDNQSTKDFSVLVISGTDNTTVKSYLNIITNGGFSDACRLNSADGTSSHVTAKAEVFQLKNGVFVRDEEASKNPTLRVLNNGKNNMSFSPSSDWDNGKGRFTLLTVTFTEADQSYNVQVPIIVKRKLEIDFTATYNYGTNFKESDYAGLGDGAHVLTSFGEPMTGLLTWTYNSANGAEVDFGWDSYMAAGGSMKGFGKSICFEGSGGRLPQGTQLTLIDANVDGKAGGREYHYIVGEGGTTSVSLSGDDGFKDSAKQPYQERWLSEILGVSAKQDNDGAWAVCDNEADATAKAKLDGAWTLFKVAGADVPSDKRYALTVPKDEGKELRASESVYLVVNVPNPVDGTGSINGYTGTSIGSGSSGGRVSVNLHRVLRPNGGKETDIQNNTASTYSILSNYGQEVVDNESGTRAPVSKSTDGAAYVLSLDVSDTITFNTSQNYAESDSLFYQLDTSLCHYDGSDALTGVSSFPSGTSAIAKFYVAIGSQNYGWNGDSWEKCDASTPAYTQTVTDTGDDSLKLRLGCDLAKIRQLATGGSFTVRTVVEEIRLTPDGCNKVIALSKQYGEDACTKMSYIAKLSTRKEGLDTSSLTQTRRGNVGYYRMDTGDTIITLSAPEKSQLGINVDDLRPIANGTIGLGATYELGGLNNAAEAIKGADFVVYTLTLQRRGADGSYVDVTDNISDYVAVTESKLAVVSATGNAITFTDTKENGKFKTQNGDATFNLPFTVKVNTQVEQREQFYASERFYANYRLVMTASLVTGDVAGAAPRSPDYVTYTLTRVNLNGIDH